MTDITKVVTKTALNVSIEELVFVPQNNCSTVNCTGLVCSILYVHCTLQTTSCKFHINSSHCTLHIVCTALHWGLLHRERGREREDDRYYQSCHKNSTFSKETNSKRVQRNFHEGQNRRANTQTEDFLILHLSLCLFFNLFRFHNIFKYIKY